MFVTLTLLGQCPRYSKGSITSFLQRFAPFAWCRLWTSLTLVWSEQYSNHLHLRITALRSASDSTPLCFVSFSHLFDLTPALSSRSVSLTLNPLRENSSMDLTDSFTTLRYATFRSGRGVNLSLRKVLMTFLSLWSRRY